jgi:hypothetical protein
LVSSRIPTHSPITSEKNNLIDAVSVSGYLATNLCGSSCGESGMQKKPDLNLADSLIEVWRQALVEEKPEVELNGSLFPVRRTAKKNLRQIEFRVGEEAVRGIEQNPKTASRWAKLARKGHKVMQFLMLGRYFANVVDGKVMLYGKRAESE